MNIISPGPNKYWDLKSFTKVFELESLKSNSDLFFDNVDSANIENIPTKIILINLFCNEMNLFFFKDLTILNWIILS